MRAVFLGLNALGDTLCTTPAIRAFRRRHPEATIIYVTQSAPFCRVLDENPDIDLLLYNERLYFQGLPEPDQMVAWLSTLPVDLREGGMLYRLDLKLVCTSAEAFQSHISETFARLVQVEIESTRPLIFLSAQDRRQARAFAGRPYLVFSPHSVSNPDREDGLGKKKDWPLEHWHELARRIAASGDFEIYVIGAERDPWVDIPHTRRLYGLPIRTLAALLESAACVVTVENGIGHLCAAVHAPMVEIYSDLMPVAWAQPAAGCPARVLYGDPLKTTPEQVFEAVQQFTCTAAVSA
jgi:ADP-heptose:LPS heptosyltransferase